jgi:membrane-bound metal-dependent hydrolase YbcI (DUF457 family)
MGKVHAATGAAAWLVGCAGAAAAGVDPHPYAVLVGTPLAAFGAIWPDIDCPSSNVARSLGWPTRWLARRVAGLGRWLYSATGTRYDGRDLDGHRTATHTLLFAILSFVGFGYLGQHGGLWAPLVMIAFAAATALRAVKVYGATRFVLTAAVALAAWHWPAPSGWWLGWAIGVGALVHNLGDRMTNTGVPLLWPIKIRGRRWYKFRAARWLRFSTGEKGNPEGAYLVGSYVLCLLALPTVAYFRWPLFAARVDQLGAALAAAWGS